MKNNFKRSYNNRLVFIVMLMLPVIIILLAGAANQMSNPSQRIGILVEGDKEEYSNAINLLEKLEGIEYRFADEHTLNTDLISGKFNIVLDYRKARTIDGFKALYYGSETAAEETLIRIKTALQTGNLMSFNEEERTAMTKTQQMLSFLLTLLMITATLNAAVMIKDKQVGTLSRFCCAPTTLFSYIGGNIAHNVILAGGQIVLALLSLKLFDIQLGISEEYFLIISLIIILIATAFATFISCISRNDMKANITASCSTVVFSLLGGAFVPIEKMPWLFQKTSIVSPIKWVIEMTKNVESGKSILDPSMPVVVLLSATLLLFIFSVIIINHNKESIK